MFREPWSWRCWPTGRSAIWVMLCLESSDLGPMPESMRSWGVRRAPQLMMISLEAVRC